MAKIYTKTGDDGTTGLLSGVRVKKSDLRLEAYGQVDHLNSTVGVLITSINDENIKNTLIEIQNKLFNLGSLLACPAEDIDKFKLKKIELDFISMLESKIDEMESDLPELKNFILPGGSLGSSYAHLCRTQARNVERRMIDLELAENSLEFINRLSDYFFSLARYINKINGVDEIIWKG